MANLHGWVLGLICLLVAPGQGASDPDATVIDRRGNRFEVSKLTYQGTGELEIWVAGERRLVNLDDVDRLRLSGEPRDEELSIVLDLRGGGELRGSIYSGGAGSVPHGEATGGGQPLQRFSGVTALGPFLSRLSDITEIILHHEGPAEAQAALRATVVTVEGNRLELRDLRFRNTRKFSFDQGRKRRALDMERIDRIEFGDTTPNTETRHVTITFRSGKVALGTVDAGTVRLSGETDRQYELRVGGALTGTARSGGIRMGLHQIKLIRFAAPPEPDPIDDSGSGPAESVAD